MDLFQRLHRTWRLLYPASLPCFNRVERTRYLRTPTWSSATSPAVLPLEVTLGIKTLTAPLEINSVEGLEAAQLRVGVPRVGGGSSGGLDDPTTDLGFKICAAPLEINSVEGAEAAQLGVGVPRVEGISSGGGPVNDFRPTSRVKTYPVDVSSAGVSAGNLRGGPVHYSRPTSRVKTYPVDASSVGV